MGAPSAKTWPDLKQAWDDYGFNIFWDQIVDYRIRLDGCYIVMLVPGGNGDIEDYFELIDFARGTDWEVQNDGSEPITKAQWDKLKIVPECDQYEYPDEDEMRIFEHDDRVGKNKKYAEAFAIYQEGYEDAHGISNIVEKWLESYTFKSKFEK